MFAGTDCVPVEPGVDEEAERRDAERAGERSRATRGTAQQAALGRVLQARRRPQRRQRDERRDEDDGRADEERLPRDRQVLAAHDAVGRRPPSRASTSAGSRAWRAARRELCASTSKIPSRSALKRSVLRLVRGHLHVAVEAVDVDLLRDVGEEAQADGLAALVARASAARRPARGPPCGSSRRAASAAARGSSASSSPGCVVSPACSCTVVAAVVRRSWSRSRRRRTTRRATKPADEDDGGDGEEAMRWRGAHAAQVNDEGRAHGPPSSELSVGCGRADSAGGLRLGRGLLAALGVKTTRDRALAARSRRRPRRSRASSSSRADLDLLRDLLDRRLHALDRVARASGAGAAASAGTVNSSAVAVAARTNCAGIGAASSIAHFSRGVGRARAALDVDVRLAVARVEDPERGVARDRLVVRVRSVAGLVLDVAGADDRLRLGSRRDPRCRASRPSTSARPACSR